MTRERLVHFLQMACAHTHTHTQARARRQIYTQSLKHCLPLLILLPAFRIRLVGLTCISFLLEPDGSSYYWLWKECQGIQKSSRASVGVGQVEFAFSRRTDEFQVTAREVFPTQGFGSISSLILKLLFLRRCKILLPLEYALRGGTTGARS